MSTENASTLLSTNPLLGALRAHTADLHRRLDEKVSAQSIITDDGYLRFLTMHARVLPAAEAWLGGRVEFRDIPDAPGRLRQAALKRDFGLLQVPMPASSNMSFLNENASVAGICYVLEGSRLGGAYLASMIARNGQRHPVNFLLQGREKPLWKTFVGWLSTRDASRAGIESATHAAENMFRAYLLALD